MRSNALDVIVIDSVAALVTKSELEGEIGDSTVGAQARLMSAALRKLTALISKARTTVHFHQPVARKDRRDVRQPGNDSRRQGAEVLRERAHGYPPHRRDQAD